MINLVKACFEGEYEEKIIKVEKNNEFLYSGVIDLFFMKENTLIVASSEN